MSEIFRDINGRRIKVMGQLFFDTRRILFLQGVHPELSEKIIRSEYTGELETVKELKHEPFYSEWQQEPIIIEGKSNNGLY